ncbi:MAG: hypothetical protein A3E38_00730 [Candidatus Moranbacteria bacterium RIFCSPHIGHO2_12_FULL_54_9]|nr:MAG: hypothetical protein A3E38_00730 [Candidatus Moranbacteria bacterium RIFCSPHIGHO2_12_FULL_54_9]
MQSDTILRRPGIFLMLNYSDRLAEQIRGRYPDATIKHIDMNGPDRSGGAFDVIILPEIKK